MKSKLRPFALELTFHAKEDTRPYDDGFYYLTNRIQRKLNENGIAHYKCDTDPHVAEVATRVFKTMDDFNTDVPAILKAAKDCGGVPSVSWSTGGGCHIHVNAFSTTKLNQATLVDWAYRQSTAYAFNHPCASGSSTKQVLVYNTPRDEGWYGERVKVLPGKFIDATNPSSTKWASLAIRRMSSGKNTIEFRFFRMPTTMQQHLDHIDFAQAYMAKILSVGYDGIAEMYAGKPIPCKAKFVSLKDAIKGFKDTIEWVGLPWERYKKYVKNIETRYAYQDCPVNGVAATERNFLN